MAAHRYRLAVQSVKSESIIADNDYPERLLKIHRRIYLLSFDFFFFFRSVYHLMVRRKLHSPVIISAGRWLSRRGVSLPWMRRVLSRPVIDGRRVPSLCRAECRSLLRDRPVSRSAGIRSLAEIRYCPDHVDEVAEIKKKPVLASETAGVTEKRKGDRRSAAMLAESVRRCCVDRSLETRLRGSMGALEFCVPCVGT